MAGVSSNVTQIAGHSEDGRPLPAEALRISAIVSLYGASNLETILQQSTPHGLNVRIPALQLLLRAQPKENLALARLASPVTHVESKDPLLLLIHGDQDIQMPINQSHELRGAYLSVGGKVEFDVIHGVGHGGEKILHPRPTSANCDLYQTVIYRLKPKRRSNSAFILICQLQVILSIDWMIARELIITSQRSPHFFLGSLETKPSA